jgi:hypothetical protein
MSALNFLMVHDGPEPVRAVENGDGVLLEANYQVPLLWLALFTPADIQRISLPLDEYGDGEIPETIPTMFAKTEDALRRYAGRKGALREALDAQHHEAMDEWERFLAAHLTKAYVQVDVEDFFGATDDFDSELLEWMDGVEQLEGGGWDSLCEMICIDDAEVAHYGMRGSSSQLELGWRE